MPKRFLLAMLLCACSLAQSNTGELRLRVIDPVGLAVRSQVELLSEANHYRNVFSTDESGNLIARHLPFGVYRLEIREPDFAPVSQTLEIRSAVPLSYLVRLNLPSVATSVTVTAAETLVDPHRVGTVNQIGPDTIDNRTTSLPGRSVQDLVELFTCTQPNISRHLFVLTKAGLVKKEKRGAYVLYSVANPRIFDLCEHVCAHVNGMLDAYLGKGGKTPA